MKLTKTIPLSEGKIEELKEIAKNSNEFFTSHVIPFFNKQVIEATSKGWKLQIGNSHYFLKGYAGLRVMIGGGQYDKEKWLHLSLSREERLPSWGDVKKVKNIFFGEEVAVIQVLPKQSEYINDHPYCLHLWYRLGKKQLVPDFRIYHPLIGKLSI